MTPPAPIGRPTDAALWASVEATLRRAVLPGLDDPHTRQVVIQLVGLAAYARDRGPDPTADRADELARELDRLAGDGHPLVTGRWSPEHGRDSAAVMTVCAEVLAAAVDADEAAQRDVRRRLRPLLVDQLDTDLASEDVLLGAFRGRLPDG
jgi:hypothetical protein